MRKENKSNYKAELQGYIFLMQGLLHYHERVSCVIQPVEGWCQKKNECPSAAACDWYREALEKSLELLKREYEAL